MSVLSVCEWLESTPIGVLVRESLYGFPILAGIHILGLTISVGTLAWFDLRLAGVSMPRFPVAALYRRLMPVMLVGFSVMFISGAPAVYGICDKGIWQRVLPPETRRDRARMRERGLLSLRDRTSYRALERCCTPADACQVRGCHVDRRMDYCHRGGPDDVVHDVLRVV